MNRTVYTLTLNFEISEAKWKELPDDELAFIVDELSDFDIAAQVREQCNAQGLEFVIVKEVP